MPFTTISNWSSVPLGNSGRPCRDLSGTRKLGYFATYTTLSLLESHRKVINFLTFQLVLLRRENTPQSYRFL
jgi:hypothetical protein